MNVITIDFETDGIEDRPEYPPVPRGVAIKRKGAPGFYLAWGHPTENNCTLEKARKILADIWKGRTPLLFHNARFDLDVAERHLGLALPPWDRVHDTLYTLFLKNPHARSLALKPSAETYLQMPPEERDAVRDWLVDHGVITKTQNPGPHICKAPGDLVGAYAIGDVERTYKLHELLYYGLDSKEKAAYDRERRLMPILLRNESEGLRFDVERATADLPAFESAILTVDDWLRHRLSRPGMNLDSDAEVSDALDSARIVTDWVLTPKTREKSISKKHLTIDKFQDRAVFQALAYRNKMSTVLGLNLRPWADLASRTGGLIYTSWDQVRNQDGGARTGRATCSKFANVPKSFVDKNDGYDPTEVAKLFKGLPQLPLVRSYLLPDKRQQWGHLDYSQQEFRIIAHYAEGELLEAYRKDPRTDFHKLMQDNLAEAGLTLQRRLVKIVNFSIKYGSGPTALAGLFGWHGAEGVAEARKVIAGVRRATPSVKALDDDLKAAGRAGEAIRTWGGRRYFCEEPRWVEKYGRQMTFEYKLLSYLIQGSGADCIKEALIRYDATKKHGRLLTTVYDEINISAPKKAMKEECAILRKAMESIEFDVPMLTDTEVGPSWGDLKEP